MPAHRHPRWTAREIALVRDLYPAGGAAAVQAELPHRTWGSIYVKANKLGVRRPPAATNATAPQPRLAGDELEEAIRLREEEGWSFARIGDRFGVSEAGACNAVMIALCPRKGFTPAERDAKGRLTDRGMERLRYALKKGLKGIDIQLRLGVSAGCVAEQRRRYNAELRANGKALLPPPGAGEQYSGVKITSAQKGEVEGLLMQGFGAKKITGRTGVSNTSVGRIRNRLVRRLRRKGETLPGCDERGVRHAQAESLRFVPEVCLAELRRLLLDRVPVRRAAGLAVVGTQRAYRERDLLREELAARGEDLPDPRLPGRVAGGGYRVDPLWPPVGQAAIYRFRELIAGGRDFDQAKAEWRARLRAERDAERARPKSFDQILERVGRGELGIMPAMARAHLDTTLLRPEASPPA